MRKRGYSLLQETCTSVYKMDMLTTRLAIIQIYVLNSASCRLRNKSAKSCPVVANNTAVERKRKEFHSADIYGLKAEDMSD